MPNPKKTSRHSSPKTPARPPRERGGLLLALGLAGVAGAIAVFVLTREPASPPGTSPHSNSPLPSASAAPARTGGTNPSTASTTSIASTTSSASAELPQMEIKQAVMVTVDLDLDETITSVADALREIERKHQPSEGTGRVFAILDAYRNPTPDERKLRLSMHVSTEKVGIGSLVRRRTGEVLWSSRIIPTADGTSRTQPSGLTILIDDGAGRTSTVDGSSNPPTILEAQLKEPGVPVAQLWPEGAEREVTFLYSACGCPVKVMCRREGARTVRTKEDPVIFPDDPEVVAIIHRLMAW